MARPDSVYHYYQKLITLRKAMDVIVYGHYRLLEPEHEDLFIYTRTWEDEELLVICNFSGKNVPYALPEAFRESSVLIGNYPQIPENRQAVRPFEAVVYQRKISG